MTAETEFEATNKELIRKSFAPWGGGTGALTTFLPMTQSGRSWGSRPHLGPITAGRTSQGCLYLACTAASARRSSVRLQ
jgi:hypothetical protein